MNILILDNSSVVRKRTIRLLQEIKEKIEIIEINKIDNLEKILAAETPDIALLDVKLKNKVRIDIIQLIKSSVPGCKIVVYSNSYAQQLKSKCLSVGADYYFDKSNEFELMLKQIENILTEVDVIIES